MEISKDALRRWALGLPALVQAQAERLFAEGALEGVMEVPRYFDARKIILTGCGAGFAAVQSVREVFDKFTDIFWGVEVLECLEFSRFYTEFSIGEPHTPLLVAVSQSGETSRVAEALDKVGRMGGNSLLITASPASPAAQKAAHVLALQLPQEDDAFVQSLNFYTAAQLALLALAQRTGYVRGTLGPASAGEWKDAAIAYAGACAQVLGDVDTEMEKLAEEWKGFDRYDFLGDYGQQSSATLCAAKFTELLGAHCAVNDTEEWCHVNFWIKPPEEIPTVIFARQQANDFGRAVETAGSAWLITRPLLVVTDADVNAFRQGVRVCRMPKLPQGYEWLSPLLHIAPVMLLLGHLAQKAPLSPAVFKYAQAVAQSAVEA